MYLKRLKLIIKKNTFKWIWIWTYVCLLMFVYLHMFGYTELFFLVENSIKAIQNQMKPMCM